ncbi:hypothetical protein M728_000638 [Ensifer sp. WSM1721]|uniref:hypothetical protein n=1 Tax=Ensifer sp. WSM1721 TaxID=1041159 RepID=UPI00047A6F1B|nr:hypothetical protein [Ensifer sp. WSM1721]
MRTAGATAELLPFPTTARYGSDNPVAVVIGSGGFSLAVVSRNGELVEERLSRAETLEALTQLLNIRIIVE